MCGRLTQRYAWRDVVAFSRLGMPVPALNLRPRYNLAPSQRAAVVREDDGERRLAMLRWGLIPFWADDPRIGHRCINARAETVAETPAFRAAYRRQSRAQRLDLSSGTVGAVRSLGVGAAVHSPQGKAIRKRLALTRSRHARWRCVPVMDWGRCSGCWLRASVVG